MAGLLLLLFIATPLVEIAVFIQAGALIGLWPTVATVVATALIGTALLRQQGLATLQRAQTNMAHGEMPVGELFEGLCLLVAGALLLTPGFVTDGVGFALLVPPLRRALGTWLLKRLMSSGRVRASAGFSAGFGPGGFGPGPGPSTGPRPDASTTGRFQGAEGKPGAKSRHNPVIDADYEDIPPEK